MSYLLDRQRRVRSNNRQLTSEGWASPLIKPPSSCTRIWTADDTTITADNTLITVDATTLTVSCSDLWTASNTTISADSTLLTVDALTL